MAAVSVIPIASLVAACAGPLPTTFSSQAAARAESAEFFGSLAARFTDVDRAPQFEAARRKLSRFALSPSGVLDDQGVWTSVSPDGTRVLEIEGSADAGRYRFAPRAGAVVPDRLGGARHIIRLARAADGSYQWNTSVEHGVGRLRAVGAAELLVAALARLEQPDHVLRSELHATFPRTGAALSRLFTLDAVQTAAVGDGSTRVDLRIGVRPERLRASGMAAFAAYVDKYVNGTRWQLELADQSGARWGEFRGTRGALNLRLRLRDGHLLALDGPARPMPDTVELRTDVVTKFLMFDVGAEQLVGDLVTLHTPRERGWTVRWQRAPRWRVPLGMRYLINGALNRPFVGPGMRLELALRDPASGAGQTLLVRRFDVAVQESALVRWFGSIGARAMADLDGRAEAEEDRFFAEVFRGLQADVEEAYSR